MKVQSKLILMYLIGALLTGATSFFAIRSYQSINKNFDAVMNDPVKKIEALRLIEQAGLRIVASTSEYGLLTSEKENAAGSDEPEKDVENELAESEEQELINVGHTRYSKALAEYKTLGGSSADAHDDYLEEIEKAGSSLLATSSELIDMKKNGAAGNSVLEKKEQFETDEKNFLTAIEKSVRHQDDELMVKKNEVTATIAESSRNVVIVTVLAFLLAGGGGFLLSRSISRPLSELQMISRRIGKGELDAPINIKTRDEFGELAADFKQMTEQLKTSQAEILKSRDFAENIIVSMADMLIAVDDDGIIEEVNASTLNILGYTEDEMIGKSVRILTQKETFLDANEFEQMVNTGKMTEVEKNFVRKNGEIIQVSISSSILHGQHAAAVIVAKDISRRLEDERRLREYAAQLERSNREYEKLMNSYVKSNERLSQSNRELQDFAYVASHDLQEPLRKVQAFGDRLQKKCAAQLSEEGNDYITRMRDAALRMQNLINDLLTFSRVTSKAQPFQPVDIKKIAQEVATDLEVRIEQTNGKVEIGELPMISADPLQMRQLIQNLVGNALKFHRADESPVIKIYAEAPSQTGGSFKIDGEEIETVGSSQQICKIVVQDNGIGFEEKYIDKIFTVFQRLHGRSEYEGSGIGLAVCRKIAERHGGNITAQSEPGRGSTFFITLPVAQNNEEHSKYE